MVISIEDVENPIKVFAEFINLIESFINDVICIDEPDARLRCSPEDFPLLDEIVVAAYDEDAPEAVKESMIRGAMFAFSEVLTKDFGLKWCIVTGGPFPGYAMRVGDSSQVLYLRNTIDKYIDDTNEICFNTLYKNIKSIVGSSS